MAVVLPLKEYFLKNKKKKGEWEGKDTKQKSIQKVLTSGWTKWWVFGKGRHHWIFPLIFNQVETGACSAWFRGKAWVL